MHEVHNKAIGMTLYDVLNLQLQLLKPIFHAKRLAQEPDHGHLTAVTGGYFEGSAKHRKIMNLNLDKFGAL